MIHWFTRRGRTGVLLLAVPVIVSAFVLLNATGSTQPSETDSDGDGMGDAYELFFGLDINANDAGLDYDSDGLSNYGEYLKLSDPYSQDTDCDGFSDLIDSNAVSRAYIRWGDPDFTTGDQYEYAHPDWLLGAYKNGGEWVVDLTATQSAWHVSAYESNGVCSLNIDLDRTILTNNLRYALHFSEGGSASAVAGRAAQAVRPSDSVGQGCPTLPSLYVDLLDTNSLPVVEDLYGNLFAISNSFDGGTSSVTSVSSGGTCFVVSDSCPSGGTNFIVSNSVLILNVPLANFPNAAVIHLRRGIGEVNIYEGLLYIDEDGDFLDADQEKQIGTSDYCVDSNNNGTNDYDECFADSSTSSPGEDDGDEDDDGDEHDGHKGKIIYVDQAIGNDQFTGRAPAIAAKKKGPKKTVRGGLSIAETNDTIIIRSGVYNENLDIRGKKDVKVFIEGNVRL